MEITEIRCDRYGYHGRQVLCTGRVGVMLNKERGTRVRWYVQYSNRFIPSNQLMSTYNHEDERAERIYANLNEPVKTLSYGRLECWMFTVGEGRKDMIVRLFVLREINERGNYLIEFCWFLLTCNFNITYVTDTHEEHQVTKVATRFFTLYSEKNLKTK